MILLEKEMRIWRKHYNTFNSSVVYRSQSCFSQLPRYVEHFEINREILLKFKENWFSRDREICNWLKKVNQVELIYDTLVSLWQGSWFNKSIFFLHEWRQLKADYLNNKIFSVRKILNPLTGAVIKKISQRIEKIWFFLLVSSDQCLHRMKWEMSKEI